MSLRDAVARLPWRDRRSGGGAVGPVGNRRLRRVAHGFSAGNRRGLPARRDRFRHLGGARRDRRPGVGAAQDVGPLCRVAGDEASFEAHDRPRRGLVAAILRLAAPHPTHRHGSVCRTVSASRRAPVAPCAPGRRAEHPPRRTAGSREGRSASGAVARRRRARTALRERHSGERALWTARGGRRSRTASRNHLGQGLEATDRAPERTRRDQRRAMARVGSRAVPRHRPAYGRAARSRRFAVREQGGQSADCTRRETHPRSSFTGTDASARASAHVCHAPARQRREPARGSRASRPRGSGDHADLHPCQPRATEARLRRNALRGP